MSELKTAKEKVLEVHPKAHVYLWTGWRNGSEGWIVSVDRAEHDEIIGRGPTEPDAWQDAWQRIESSKPIVNVFTNMGDAYAEELDRQARVVAEGARGDEPIADHTETEMSYRRIMWVSHGHIGIYGDDGEMQCGECAKFKCLDYKNSPLVEVETAYHAAILERASAFLPTIKQIPAVGEQGGVGMIAAERARQVAVEGWTPEHDDAHIDASLVGAARAYLWVAHCEVTLNASAEDFKWVPNDWPKDWDDTKFWKPSNDPIRNLVKAGALIAAEIDRLQRAHTKKESAQ